jgi:UDP-N-acetylglucosamine--N-acetylmuramyl-(pentapeptide) pyrophosphoryl-undecaprenol N-acetylglucosamine transferase
MAAWTLRVPVLIYLPDIVPGLAIRFLSRFATRIAVTSKDSFQYLPRSKCVVTGYPVRPELLALDRSEARRRLGLDPNGPVLLVLGGSRGAKSINRALVAGLPELLSICQVVHISGKLDADWVRDATAHLPEALQGRYHLYPYLHEIPAAMVAADLAVARAGAATMGEFPAAALPAVLVPYPYSGQHQQPNAAYLSRNGAALVLDDGEISTQLLPAVQGLLRDREKRERMRMASRALSCPGAAEAIAEHLRALARQHSHGAAG